MKFKIFRTDRKKPPCAAAQIAAEKDIWGKIQYEIEIRNLEELLQLTIDEDRIIIDALDMSIEIYNDYRE